MDVVKCSFLGILAAMLLILPVDSLLAQERVGSDSTWSSTRDSTSEQILLYPDALPDTRSAGFLNDPGQSFSTQISYIDGGLGLEMIYTGKETRSFFSLMLGSIGLDKSVNYRVNMLTSVTYGYKATISSSGTASSTIKSKRRVGNEPAITFFGQPEFYVRIGPGLSTIGTEHYSLGDWESERLIGYHAFGLLGASVRIADRSRLNIEVGWRGMWFPASEDLRQMNGPHVTFGFSFSGSRPVNTINW